MSKALGCWGWGAVDGEHRMLPHHPQRDWLHWMLSLQTSECTLTIQASNSSYCMSQPALFMVPSVCPPAAASHTPRGRERSLLRRVLLVPHQVPFPGQATPLPAAAVHVIDNGSKCPLVWTIAHGEQKLLYPRDDMSFLLAADGQGLTGTGVHKGLSASV